jgi:hypothetical protein
MWIPKDKYSAMTNEELVLYVDQMKLKRDELIGTLYKDILSSTISEVVLYLKDVRDYSYIMNKHYGSTK